MTDNFIKEFIEHSIYRVELNTPRINKCLKLLSEKDVWKRPNDQSNSIGNLILHLCGNIRQYIISSLGKSEDFRERDLEFTAEGGLTKSELQGKLEDTVGAAVNVIRNASIEELLRVRLVQGFDYSGVGVIIHVTEHYSYHTGQIAFWTKVITGSDLGFYSNVDLNIRN